MRNVDPELIRVIGEFRSKLESGFEVLAQKVTSIERSQHEMLDKIEQLHRVVYEPDDGLFARLKHAEISHENQLKPLQKDVQQLIEWQQSLIGKDGAITQVNEHNRSLSQLVSWKNRIIAIALSAFGATGLTLAKLIWDYVSLHVTVH